MFRRRPRQRTLGACTAMGIVALGFWLLAPASACATPASSGVDGGSDAASDAPLPCNQLTQLGEAVEIETVTAPAPSPEGGTLGTGNYVLLQLLVHNPRGVSVGKTGVTLRQTLSIEGTTLRIVETDQRGEARSNSTLTSDGGLLFVQDDCVATGTDAGPGTGPARTFAFSASEGSVLLVSTNPTADAGVTTSLRYVRPAAGDR